MGWGLPAAIGAYFSKKKNQTICLTGDGGLSDEHTGIIYNHAP